MKKFILFISILSSNCIYSNASDLDINKDDIYDEEWPVLGPLWEEKGKLCYYRVLLIENGIFTIEKLIKQLKDNPEDSEETIKNIEQELSDCRYNLGLKK